MPPDVHTEPAPAQPIKLAYYLPFGEMLRVLLDQQSIAASDLRILLRERGVFVPDNEKAQFIPPIAFATVTPIEFEGLLDKQRTREDSYKALTRFVKWSSERSLLDAVPTEFALNSLTPEGSSYHVAAPTGFRPVDGNANHLRLDFKIERADLHKDWTKGGATYDGRVDIEKVGHGDAAQLVITSTAPETKEVGKQIARVVTAKLKEQGDVNSKDEALGIDFASFGNAERVTFLLSFTGANEANLRFEAITDCDVGPDDKTTIPAEISEFVEQVTQFQLHGAELQRSFFILKSVYHPFIVLSRMQARYRFEYQAAKGTCTIEFSFPGYSPRTRAGEFEVRLNSISVDREYRKVNHLRVYREVDQIVQGYAQQILRVRRATVTAAGAASDPLLAVVPDGNGTGHVHESGSL